jgi:hypothetical protein
MNNFNFSSYEDASVSIASNTKQLVRTALLFDSLFKQDKHVSWGQYEIMVENDNDEIFDIEETSIPIILNAPEGESIEAALLRNLDSKAQSTFGFQFSPQVQVSDDYDEVISFHLYLQKTQLEGVHLAQRLLKTHHVFAGFSIVFERDEVKETWGGATLAFNDVIVSQKKIDIAEQRETASLLSKTIEEMDQLDLMCTMAGSFSPYLKLLD